MKTSPLTGRTAHSAGRRLALVLALLSATFPAAAWNGAGHRLVAAIAWEYLHPEVRDEVDVLLRRHPDHARWLRRAKGDDSARMAFIESSTWPDEIRQDTRFYSAGSDEPTPTLPGYPDMERRRNWHYVNIPLDATAEHAPLSGLLDRQLAELTQTLESSTDEQERRYALPWVIHLVGDAHQPLHTSVRLDKAGRWDKLGNGLEVHNPFNTRKPVSTLHAYWDDLPGPPWLRGNPLDAAARALIATYPRPAPSVSSKPWIRESWEIAREHGYPPQSEATPTITSAFFENSREIASRRVTQAGYRLADLLNQAMRPQSR